MIQSKCHDHKIDMWALGILLYELIHGFPPFKGKTNEEKFSKIITGVFEFYGATTDAQNLIKNLLISDSNTRAGFDFVFNHPWIKHYEKKFNMNVNDYVYKKKTNKKDNLAMNSSTTSTKSTKAPIEKITSTKIKDSTATVLEPNMINVKRDLNENLVKNKMNQIPNEKVLIKENLTNVVSPTSILPTISSPIISNKMVTSSNLTNNSINSIINSELYNSSDNIIAIISPKAQPSISPKAQHSSISPKAQQPYISPLNLPARSRQSDMLTLKNERKSQLSDRNSKGKPPLRDNSRLLQKSGQLSASVDSDGVHPKSNPITRDHSQEMKKSTDNSLILSKNITTTSDFNILTKTDQFDDQTSNLSSNFEFQKQFSLTLSVQEKVSDILIKDDIDKNKFSLTNSIKPQNSIKNMNHTDVDMNKNLAPHIITDSNIISEAKEQSTTANNASILDLNNKKNDFSGISDIRKSKLSENPYLYDLTLDLNGSKCLSKNSHEFILKQNTIGSEYFIKTGKYITSQANSESPKKLNFSYKSNKSIINVSREANKLIVNRSEINSPLYQSPEKNRQINNGAINDKESLNTDSFSDSILDSPEKQKTDSNPDPSNALNTNNNSNPVVSLESKNEKLYPNKFEPTKLFNINELFNQVFNKTETQEFDQLEENSITESSKLDKMKMGIPTKTEKRQSVKIEKKQSDILKKLLNERGIVCFNKIIIY